MCQECRNKARVQRTPASPHTIGGGAPPIVGAVLRSPGHTLDASARAFMEPRFGHDFSRVRVHTDARADASAREVSARAYTVGQHIVFRRGEYDLRSDTGRRLLAHELAHTLQQRGGVESTETLRIGHPDSADERSADAAAAAAVGAALPRMASREGGSAVQVQRACGPAAIDTPSGCTGVQGDVAGERFRFVVNCDDLSPGEQKRLELFAGTIAPGETISVHGFASIDGTEEFNEHLSCARSVKALSILAGVLTSRGVSASLRIFKHGANPGSDPAEQRSVVLDRSGTAPGPPPATAAAPPAPPPKFVCGPDVTGQVTAAVARTRSTFAGWSKGDKDSACDALDSLSTGAIAWDIVELHNNGWILNYRPGCATVGATPPCGSTVQVGTECYYAGSPNYVIYGVMCKLCHAHFTATAPSEAARFTQAKMEYWIDFYKGKGITGRGTPSANFGPSRDWAIAGYGGWPSGTGPAGDRAGCAPVCATPYTDPPFTVNWVPKGVF
jgi:outer membrane protein OmpA-like peptidoglycan-associated protein